MNTKSVLKTDKTKIMNNPFPDDIATLPKHILNTITLRN